MRFCDALTVDYSALKYDMVFTSPPYYDLEQYGTRESTTARTKEEWDNTFYRPLFRETYQYLAKGGHYCLNIPVEIFERVCRDILGEPWKRVSLKKSDRQQTDSSKKYVEYVYIWKK
jgi:DNA modification methylase